MDIQISETDLFIAICNVTDQEAAKKILIAKELVGANNRIGHENLANTDDSYK